MHVVVFVDSRARTYTEHIILYKTFTEHIILYRT